MGWGGGVEGREGGGATLSMQLLRLLSALEFSRYVDIVNQGGS